MNTQFKLATQSLKLNKVRTALTTLGIIIGVASLTLVLSLGQGAQEALGTQIEKLGNNLVAIKPGTDAVGGLKSISPYDAAITSSLTERDSNSIKLHENVAKSAPIMMLSGTISVGENSMTNVPIIATTPELAEILGIKTAPGQFIDDTVGRDTIVLGRNIAISLSGTDQVLGLRVNLKGRDHSVIGIAKEYKASINVVGVDLNNAVFVPLDDGKMYNQGVAQIQQIIVTLLITLIVGGVGIMNIMLVGVSERTREIGIRKALGATNRNIFMQFLIEALIMCAIGGIVGLALGYGLAFFVGRMLYYLPLVSWQNAIAGILMAFVIGIAFGIYPALKAAHKDPIESLRQYQ